MHFHVVEHTLIQAYKVLELYQKNFKMIRDQLGTTLQIQSIEYRIEHFKHQNHTNNTFNASSLKFERSNSKYKNCIFQDGKMIRKRYSKIVYHDDNWLNLYIDL